MDRPAIPTELKRRLLVEAGHRCAIPTCRVFTTEFAHIESWAIVQEHSYENLIVLCPNCHTRFDKGDMDKKSMFMYKDNLRFVVEKYSKFELDILLELSRLPSDQGLPYQSIYFLLIKAILEEKFVAIIQQSGEISFGGIRMNPDALVITDSGRQFVKDFSTVEIGYTKPS